MKRPRRRDVAPTPEPAPDPDRLRGEALADAIRVADLREDGIRSIDDERAEAILEADADLITREHLAELIERARDTKRCDRCGAEDASVRRVRRAEFWLRRLCARCAARTKANA